MNRRRYRMSDEDRLYEISMENADKNDLIAITGYLFNITKTLSNEQLCEEEIVYTVLSKLADNLNLTNRFKYVVFHFVQELLAAGKLHYYSRIEDETCNETENTLRQPFTRRSIRRMKAERTFVFSEDEEINNLDSDFLDMSENERNYYRAMITKGKGIFSQILYYTFFSKAEVNIKCFHNQIPVRFQKRIHDTSRLDFLKKELPLSREEAEYLLFRYRKTSIELVYEIFDKLTNNSLCLYTNSLGITKKQFQQVTRRDSKLHQYGFINDSRNLNPALLECIEAQDFSLYFADFIKTQKSSKTYDLNSFSVPLKNTKIYKNLLQSDNPVSILLYGAPGAGKTEYAKALVNKAGKKIVLFKNESEVIDRDDVLSRLNCLLSLERKDSVLIVDEAESLLSTKEQSFFGSFVSAEKKGVINKMLENSRNKVIWIVNYKNQMDESTLRRFTVSHKFEPMSVAMLESIASKKLKNLELKEDTKKEIISLLSKYKVTGASVDNLITTVNSMNNTNEKELLEDIGIVLQDNSTLLHGKAKMRSAVKETYDMSVLNTSIAASKIITMLLNAKIYGDKNPGAGAVRMLFYGLSGTGKTEFARYISSILGKDILLKRASDIIDKYVGETEKRIAAAFEEAAANNQILLFDEADSFFSDRKNAEQDFERTRVNEFLTQLEEFTGFVICTTNLRNIMDPAMLRRFHITVDFKALTKEGIKTLLSKFFRGIEFSNQMIDRLAGYNTVTPGDFGRLADTIKFMDAAEIDGKFIIEQLENIQKEKMSDCDSGRKVGFCA